MTTNSTQIQKRVTTKDIAQKAGVSKATVSYALNGTGSVSSETVKRIQDIAQSLGYQENRLAKATRTGITRTIALVLPDLCNPFFPEMAQAVVETASQQGYSVFLVDARNSFEEEALGLRRLIEYAVDGVIWCPLDDRHMSKHQFNCPVVVTDRFVEGYDCVYADSLKGGQLQAKLINDKGHQKIGLLSGPERSTSSRHRRDGFYETLAKNTQVDWEYSLEYSIDIPPDIAQKIISSNVTCVAAANDTLAIGLLRLYHSANIRVPQDVSIIGFDDISWSNLVYPPLSTIKLPIREMGKKSFEVLLQRIHNPSKANKEVILDVSLLERESVKAYS